MSTLSDLRDRLYALVEVMVEQAERDETFARKVTEALDGRRSEKIAGRPAKPQDVPDPFAAYRAEGRTGLETMLRAFEVEDLRKIIRAHRLDPSRLSDKWKSAERLATLVLDGVEQRAKQGDVFRQYRDRDATKHATSTGDGASEDPPAPIETTPLSLQQRLEKFDGKIVRLTPRPRRGRDGEEADDEWRLGRQPGGTWEVSNTRTGHCWSIPIDTLVDIISPDIIKLKVRLILDGPNIRTEAAALRRRPSGLVIEPSGLASGPLGLLLVRGPGKQVRGTMVKPSPSIAVGEFSKGVSAARGGVLDLTSQAHHPRAHG